MHTQRLPPMRMLVGLAAFVAASCQSVDLPRQEGASTALPVSLRQSACAKADDMWNERIIASRYAALPALSSPGVGDAFQLLRSHYSAKAFTTPGDELEPGRSKLIHARGAEARLRLVVLAGGAGGYTGIFADGADCVIGRFSMATKPSATTSIPALSLKFFIAGAEPSVNLLLMHSVDAQPGHDFFARSFSNILPPAEALSKRILSAAFERSAETVGARDTNPGRLTLEHLSGIRTDGQRIATPRTPYQLLFKPTAAAQALTQSTGVGAGDDFRVRLAALPVGQALYDVFALAEGDPPEAATPVGQLLLTSAVVASRYGDEKLYFRHHTARN